MDGNRRYGKVKYGSGLRGHSDGSRTLVSMADWCMEAGIEALTVFAFSTGTFLCLHAFEKPIAGVIHAAFLNGIHRNPMCRKLGS